MSDKKISELPVASVSNSTDIFVINQGGVSKTVERSLMPSGDFLADGSVPMTGDFNAGNFNFKKVSQILDYQTTPKIAIDIHQRKLYDNAGNITVTFDTQAYGIGLLNATGYLGWISSVNLATANELFQLPDKGGAGGTFAMLDDIAGGGVTSVSGTTNRITSTGGATPVIDIAANPVLAGIQGMVVPTGATADRAGSPSAGTIRYNTTILAFECFYGGVWNTLATSVDADPTTPTPDGIEYYESVTDGVKTWERVPVVSGTSGGNKTKLQAGATGDWVNGSYVGATSGATSGTFGGEKFIGQDTTDTYYYNYEALQNDVWVRSLAVSQGSGISRSISNVSGVTSTLGATVKTDYVVICTGTNTLTLPTAVGNTNQYTIKLTSGTTILNTTSSQTIDGSTSISLTVAYTSFTIISNNTNWVII
jgi:hypothetical protein